MNRTKTLSVSGLETLKLNEYQYYSGLLVRTVVMKMARWKPDIEKKNKKYIKARY